MKNSSDIIIRPLLTEKMSRLEESERKYAFQVTKKTNKIEIKKAVEKKFNVQVLKVSTMNLSGKQKTMTVQEWRQNNKNIRIYKFLEKSDCNSKKRFFYRFA